MGVTTRWGLQIEGAMSCPLCGSGSQAEFPAEMMIHFSGLKNLDKPGIWLFQKLLVCLDCGVLRLRVPEKELALLASVPAASELFTMQQEV